MNRHDFRNPPAAYRGVALWMLNDKLEEEEIARQLEGIARAGWGAVIGRTFNGLRTEYLGDEWMAIMARIIAGAKELGVRVWLQAGYMPSAIPNLDPARAHRGVAMRPRSEPIPEGETVLYQDEEHAYTQRVLPTVLDLLNADAVTDYLDLAYRDPWQSRFGEHFGETVEAVWVDEPHFRPPLYPWSERLPETFARQWGYDPIPQLPSLFRHVGDYQKLRHHYWRVVLAMFLEGYFEPVGRWCGEHNIKFSGHLMGEDTLNSQIAWTGAVMPCYEPMHLPGIDHLTLSLTWPSHKKFLLPPKQVSSAAGQLGREEVLAEMYAVSSQGITFADRKQIACWMMALGINYRCYHGAFYSLRGRRKRIYAPHLSYQQPWWPDNRLIADPFARLSYALRRGQTRAEVLLLHPVESTFCLFDPVSMLRPHDRLSEPQDVKEQDTRLVDLCDHLMSLHRGFEFGDETLMAKHGSVDFRGLRIGRMTYPVVILPDLITIRRSTLELLEQFAAAYGTILSTGTLPTRVDGVPDPGLAERLAPIVRPVAPERAALKHALDAAKEPELEIRATVGDPGDVWVQSREVEEGRLLFLTNVNRRAGVEGELVLQTDGLPEEWCLETGDVRPAPSEPEEVGLVVPLSLPPLGMRLLLLRTAPPAPQTWGENGAPQAPQTWGENGAPPAPQTWGEQAADRWLPAEVVTLAGQGTVRRDTPNALTLDICRWRKGDGAWSAPIPVIGLQEELEREKYAGPLSLRFAFQVAAVPASLQVVVEDAEQYDIRVNGEPAPYAGLPYYVDRCFHPVDATALVREGENTVDLSVDFRPLGKASFSLASLFEKKEGVELESIYLIGDFAVRGGISDAEARPGCLRCRPGFILDREPAASTGDLTAEGYPFHAGRATYAESVTLRRPFKGERVLLELPGLDAVLAKVRVNGQAAGAVLWPPYEVEITGLVVEGENAVEVELVNSLRNLLGPHHRSTGEPTHTWATAYDFPPDRGRPSHPEEAEATWTDDYFVVHFGLRGPLKVKYLRRG